MTEREVKVIIQLTFERDEARDQRDALRKERDDARQLACEFCVMDGSGYSSSYRAKEEARARGWDCFKETP